MTDITNDDNKPTTGHHGHPDGYDQLAANTATTPEADNDEESGGGRRRCRNNRKLHTTSTIKRRKDLTTRRHKHSWIIYPSNKYMRIWDPFMLLLIVIYSFTIPYGVGISGGVRLLYNQTWLVINVVWNSFFFIDTFLPFFRAYTDHLTGEMVLDPAHIRKNYLQTLFLPNLLSNVPTTLLFYYRAHKHIKGRSEQNLGAIDSSNLLKIFDILKLLRLSRVGRLLHTSEAVREFKEKRKAFTLRLWTFVFYIIVAGHWFACIWCFIAYLEVGSWNHTAMLAKPNWIGLWYNTSYVEGGLNPLGWENDIDRYALSLFWAIQTITSIGYGNIAPLTTAEWMFGAMLQLTSGILWAYIIGGLVGVVTAMEVKNEEFRQRIDDANNLISAFMERGATEVENSSLLKKTAKSTAGALSERFLGNKKNQMTNDNDDDDDNNHQLISITERHVVAKRIRRFLYSQSERPTSINGHSSTLQDAFPVLATLSPELQRSASLMLVQSYLERVPYLRTKFLSTQQQAHLAWQCIVCEFPKEEVIHLDRPIRDYDGLISDSSGSGGDASSGRPRGVLVQLVGSAWRSSEVAGIMPIVSGGVIGEIRVLLNDNDFYDRNGGTTTTLSAGIRNTRRPTTTITFTSFSQCLFIPRSAILEALASCPKAWRECAKWFYLGGCLVEHASQQVRRHNNNNDHGEDTIEIGHEM